MKRLFILLFAVGCSYNEPAMRQMPPVPVEDAVVESKDVPIYLKALGNVYARITVRLKPQVQGRILKTHVKQGQVVKKGELLYTIDPRVYQANLDKALAILEKDEAALVFAKQKLERYSQLKEKEFVSPLTLEELKSNVDSGKAQILGDKAAVELARIDREYCDVYSPINGKISQFQLDVGNLVKAFDDNALTEILQIQPVEVRFSFPQKDFLEIKKYYTISNLPFTVIDPNHPEKHYFGVVDFIDNKIDLNTGTILLKGVVDNKEEQLWPGAYVWVTVLLKTAKNALVVPKEAVQIGQQGPFVFVIGENKKVELRQVVTGPETDGKQIIEKGIKEGERVVTNGQINLRPGSTVWIKGEK